MGKPGRIQREIHTLYKTGQSELVLCKPTGSDDGSSDLCLYGDCSRLLKLHQSPSCFQTLSLQILQYWLHRADFLLIVWLLRLSWVLSKEKSLYLSILLAEWNKQEWCLQLWSSECSWHSFGSAPLLLTPKLNDGFLQAQSMECLFFWVVEAGSSPMKIVLKAPWNRGKNAVLELTAWHCASVGQTSF